MKYEDMTLSQHIYRFLTTILHGPDTTVMIQVSSPNQEYLIEAQGTSFSYTETKYQKEKDPVVHVETDKPVSVIES